MDEMMGRFIGGMGKGGRLEMMGKMMAKFMADLTPENKQHRMERMMPKMMEGMNMAEMMPMCLSMMLAQLPREKREAFALSLVSTLFKKACADMSEVEKAAFRAKVAEKMGV